MQKKIGVLLSGCGVMDGSEIHESVLTMLAISKHGAEAICIAPDIDQTHVINHITHGHELQETRNVLVESARIARGKIKDIKNTKASELDALIFPGGYGVTKNLCTFEIDETSCKVNPDVALLVREIHQAGKPIGAICIAPALIAKIFQNDLFQMTIGNDIEVAGAIEKMGHMHMKCGVNQTFVDKKHKIVTTPAYMLAQNIAEAYEGIDKLVVEVIGMI